MYKLVKLETALGKPAPRKLGADLPKSGSKKAHKKANQHFDMEVRNDTLEAIISKPLDRVGAWLGG